MYSKRYYEEIHEGISKGNGKESTEKIIGFADEWPAGVRSTDWP